MACLHVLKGSEGAVYRHCEAGRAEEDVVFSEFKLVSALCEVLYCLLICKGKKKLKYRR